MQALGLTWLWSVDLALSSWREVVRFRIQAGCGLRSGASDEELAAPAKPRCPSLGDEDELAVLVVEGLGDELPHPPGAVSNPHGSLGRIDGQPRLADNPGERAMRTVVDQEPAAGEFLLQAAEPLEEGGR